MEERIAALEAKFQQQELYFTELMKFLATLLVDQVDTFSAGTLQADPDMPWSLRVLKATEGLLGSIGAQLGVVKKAPICPTHNKEMAKRHSKTGSFWSCGTRD